jgi:hypothetical protein
MSKNNEIYSLLNIALILYMWKALTKSSISEKQTQTHENIYRTTIVPESHNTSTKTRDCGAIFNSE